MLAAGLLFAASSGRAQEDNRQLVELPEMMQQHMLSNMRDHLRALEEILANLAEGNADKAAAVAEKRLGMSSLSRHGAAHLAQFLPKAMKDAGTQMHKSASQFTVKVQNAEVTQGTDAQRAVYGALQKVIANCNACHQAYRIR